MRSLHEEAVNNSLGDQMKLDSLFQSNNNNLMGLSNYRIGILKSPLANSDNTGDVSEDSAEIKDEGEEEEPRVDSERSSKFNCIRNAIMSKKKI